jgi:cbb3-type cytochrome oxidase maturation protein
LTLVITSRRQGIYFYAKDSQIMNVIIILIAASILIAGGFLVAFLWSVRNGQYDDDYTPSVRMLYDDATPTSSKDHSPQNNQIHK